MATLNIKNLSDVLHRRLRERARRQTRPVYVHDPQPLDDLVVGLESALDDVLAAINDGILTIGELEGMDSLRTGSADSYHEILQPFFPSGGAKVPKINIVASGALQDGRSFFMLWEHTNTPFLTETILRFGE